MTPDFVKQIKIDKIKRQTQNGGKKIDLDSERKRW
jgi:hypothetical protein